eukprot:14610547-Ditylum_brightwellii.AAC.2
MPKHSQSITIGQKLLIPLAFWAESIDSEWWMNASYHPSMIHITVDMALHNVALAGQRIGRVRNGVFDVTLISHLDDNEYNEMTIQD